LASTIQYEKRFQEKMDGQPVWCVSVDDLRVLKDLFQTSIEFTHYLQQRLRAYGHPALQTAQTLDELDHVGLYLQHNQYLMELEGYLLGSDPLRLQPSGFSEIFDRHYYELALGEQPASPRQKMPSLLRTAIEILSESPSIASVHAAHDLLDLGGAARNDWARMVREELKAQDARGKPRHISLAPTSISFSCSVRPFQESQNVAIRQNAAAAAVLRGGEEQCVFYLVGTGDGHLQTARAEVIALAELDADERERARLHAETMGNRRVANVKEAVGKIGRNEKCPCGSGKKFKRCHGR